MFPQKNMYLFMLKTKVSPHYLHNIKSNLEHLKKAYKKFLHICKTKKILQPKTSDKFQKQEVTLKTINIHVKVGVSTFQ